MTRKIECGSVRFGVFVFFGLFLLVNCERTMVFGESSGFNIEIASDAAKSAPLEVNFGLKRQVLAIVPPTGKSERGVVEGEATSMISRFQIAQQKSSTGNPFGNIITTNSAFASGRAAIAVVGGSNATSVVKSIVTPVSLRLSDEPATRDTAGILSTYVTASQSNLEKYLSLAESKNLTLTNDPNAITKALKAIILTDNAAKNADIRKDLKL